MLRALWLAAFLAATQVWPVAGQPMLEPRVNPVPQQRIEIDWWFDGLPGAARVSSVSARYEVNTIECVPPDHARALGGVRLRPAHVIDVATAPQAPERYRATLYADAFLATPSPGQGPCRWAPASVTLTFRAPGHEVDFIATLGQAHLASRERVSWSFRQVDFQRPPPMQAIFGEAAGYYRAGEAQFTLNAILRR